MLFHLWIYSNKELLYSTNFSSHSNGIKTITTTDQQSQNIELFLPIILNLAGLNIQDKIQELNSLTIAGLQVYAYSYKQFILILSTVNGLPSNLFLNFAQQNFIVLEKLTNEALHSGLEQNTDYQNQLINLKEKLDKEIEKNKEITIKQAETEFWDSVEETNTFSNLKDSRVNKYLILGAARAGKSSIYHQFMDNWSQDQLQKIKPTVDKWISKIEDDLTAIPFLIYDLGGQKQYITRHLQDKKLFRNLRCIIFVIDVQDNSNSNTQIVENYFTSVLEKVKQNNENPKFVVFLHKFDPEQYFDLYPKVTEWMNIMNNIFRDHKQVTYYLTSINNDSAKDSMARTFLFTMPQQFLKRTMNTDLITNVTNSLSDLFTKLNKATSEEESSLIKEEIYLNSIPFGYDSAQNLIKDWIATFLHNKPENEENKLTNVTYATSLWIKTADRKVALFFKTELPPAIQGNPAIVEITKGLLEGLGGLLGLNDALLLDKKVKTNSVECMIEMSY